MHNFLSCADLTAARKHLAHHLLQSRDAAHTSRTQTRPRPWSILRSPPQGYGLTLKSSALRSSPILAAHQWPSASQPPARLTLWPLWSPPFLYECTGSYGSSGLLLMAHVRAHFALHCWPFGHAAGPPWPAAPPRSGGGTSAWPPGP
jgi:hypothetical protein